MSDNALDEALRIIGCDTGSSGDHCAQALSLTTSTLLDGEARSTATQWKPNLPTKRRKKRRRREVVRRQLGNGD
jgi:hypothetical protein